MSRHTAGPWEYIHDEDKTSVVVGGADKRTVIHTHWEPDNAEAVADARLIAAAPDLLDALTELVDLKAMKAGITTNAGIEEYERRKPAAWEAARAAVAKAKGETS